MDESDINPTSKSLHQYPTREHHLRIDGRLEDILRTRDSLPNNPSDHPSSKCSLPRYYSSSHPSLSPSPKTHKHQTGPSYRSHQSSHCVPPAAALCTTSKANVPLQISQPLTRTVSARIVGLHRSTTPVRVVLPRSVLELGHAHLHQIYKRSRRGTMASVLGTRAPAPLLEDPHHPHLQIRAGQGRVLGLYGKSSSRSQI